MSRHPVSRRHFILGTAAALGTSALSSCVPRFGSAANTGGAHAADTIVYGVVPRNFGTPGFQGVTNRLDDLHDLGINAIWLSPINTTIPGDFGYAVVDYLDVRPDYGTKEDFKALVDAAHERKIRVLMDFVPNHTSVAHVLFQKSESGPGSEYYDWYDRDASGQVTHYFDWDHLPNLNYNNPKVRQYMIDAFKFWVERFDVDGFRVDAAWGIRERSPEFWPLLSKELKRVKPSLLLLAEAGARDDYYITHGFDAAYDWNDEIGHWAWEDVFSVNGLVRANLADALTNRGQGFSPKSVVFRFINNNDTGERFVTTHGPAMTRVAAALLLTLPGMPCIYTGDEVGAAFEPYDTDGPISWTDEHGLRPYYNQLITLRTTMPSLRSLAWEPVAVTQGNQVFAYLRHTNTTDPALVVLNFADEPATPLLELPASFQSFAQHQTLRDVLGNADVPWGGTPLRLDMPASSARILTIAS